MQRYIQGMPFANRGAFAAPKNSLDNPLRKLGAGGQRAICYSAASDVDVRGCKILICCPHAHSFRDDYFVQSTTHLLLQLHACLVDTL